MKILHILWSFSLGGAESMLVDIANIQVASHDVSLLLINDMNSDLLLGKLNKDIRAIQIKRTPGSRNISNLIRIYLEIFALNPDIIHIHYSDLIKVVPPVYSNIVLTVHDTGLEIHKSKRVKATIAISRAVADDLSARYKLTNVKVIYNGVPCSKIRCRENLEYMPFKIIQISRLMHEKKGQDILLKAVKIAKEKTGYPIHLHFLGDGPSHDYLKELTYSLGLQHVEFLGEREREFVFDKLCNYNLLVQPSRHEGFGLTIVEAMAAKVPVLVSNIEGPFEIIQEDTYGFSFRNKDVEDCADKLIKIYELYQSQSGGYLDSLTERAYNHALENFDINKMVEQYEKEYLSIIYKNKNRIAIPKNSSNFVICDNLSPPYDEGIKNICVNIIKGMVNSYRSQLITDEGIGIVDNQICYPLGKTFIVKDLILLLRKLQPNNILYIPNSSLTIASFARAAILRFISPRSKIYVMGLQERKHSYLTKIFLKLIKPHGLFVLSEKMRHDSSGLSNQIEVFTPGVDINRFIPVSVDEKKHLRQQYNISENAYVILHVGHLKKSRNLDIIVDALQGMSSIFVVVASSTFNIEKDLSVVSMLKQSNTIIMAETIDAIENIYKISDCYVFPVIEKTGATEMPLSVLEAMAVNLAVITTPYGALPEVFPENRTKGFFFAHDAASFAEALQAVMKIESIETRKMVESYSWQGRIKYLAEKIGLDKSHE